MTLTPLRYLLRLDAAVLLVLGAVLVLAPGQVERAFHFKDLPPAVSYIIGLWGCALGTLGIGYLVASTNPVKHRVWVQIGIARGVLECGLGVYSVARGSVTLEQAQSGIILAALISVGYCLFYPRKPRLAQDRAASTAAWHSS